MVQRPPETEGHEGRSDSELNQSTGYYNLLQIILLLWGKVALLQQVFSQGDEENDISAHNG